MFYAVFDKLVHVNAMFKEKQLPSAERNGAIKHAPSLPEMGVFLLYIVLLGPYIVYIHI